MKEEALERCQACNLFNHHKCAGCYPSRLKCELVQERLAERKAKGIGLEHDDGLFPPSIRRADLIVREKCEPMKRKEGNK